MKIWLYDFNGWNKELFLTIYQITHNHEIIHILNYLSLVFTTKYFIIHYLFTAITLYYVLGSYRKDIRYQYFVAAYNFLVGIGVSYIMFLATYIGLKNFIGLPRPYCSIYAIQFTTSTDIVTSSTQCYTSFPSGHTGLAVLIVAHLWQYLNRIYRISAILLVMLVATTRIAFAMHYPADVIYACIISIIITYITHIISNLRTIQHINKVLQSNLYKLIY